MNRYRVKIHRQINETFDVEANSLQEAEELVLQSGIALKSLESKTVDEYITASYRLDQDNLPIWDSK